MGVKITLPKKFNKKLKDLKSLSKNNLEVVVGIPTSDNKQHKSSDKTIAEIGALHEFGEEGQTERSFLRAPIKKNTKKYNKFFIKSTPKILSGKMSLEKFLGQLGAIAQSDSVESFSVNDWLQVSEQRLKQKTVNGNVGNVPLVDTGQLRQSITFKVRSK